MSKAKKKKNTHTFGLHNTLSLAQIHYFKNANKYNTIHEWQKVKWKTKRQNGQMEKPKTNSREENLTLINTNIHPFSSFIVEHIIQYFSILQAIFLNRSSSSCLPKLCIESVHHYHNQLLKTHIFKTEEISTQ